MTEEKKYIIPVDKIRPFYLSDTFLDDYKNKKVNWRFGDLGLVTYKRTYARKKDDGNIEDWWETCQRVVEGVFTIQKAHCARFNLPWDNRKAQQSAKEMYDRMFEFKWLPPGRGLWMMGTDFIYERSGAPLNNCAYISTKNIDMNYGNPFGWSFEMSMLGVGVGFGTEGKELGITIQEPQRSDESFVIADSREGWREALEKLLNAFVGEDELPSEWDFSEIRGKGEPIESFGGTASGPAPLKKMLETLEDLYTEYIGEYVDSRLIVDTMNIAGKCVVSGGVRRTAQISFSEPSDEQFLDLKTDMDKVSEYRWASNNSVFAELGMDYSDVAERTATNGEPGYAWLENMRKYGRMKDEANWKDYRVAGGNPCLEQSLEHKELCCLVETFPAHADDLDDYMKTLKYAYMYAKTVTLLPTHDKETNAVMMRNRRIGCSMSGIVQNIEKIGMREHFNWCDESYEHIQELDKKYSDWLAIPRSIKTTSVKPSGTVSILAGATPGIHFDEAPMYIRRIRIQDTSALLKPLEEAGYHIEEDHYSDDTMVVEFPIKVPNLKRAKYEVSLWEKMELAAMMQYYWADNQVSCTISFNEEEKDDIAKALPLFEHRLKGISFLPYSGHGYVQAPYEEIDEDRYNEIKNKISPVKLTKENKLEHEATDEFCDGDACAVDFG